MKDCFSITPVNLGRQRELDIAKVIATVLMLFCHFGMEFFVYDSPSYYVAGYLGTEFVAPVFMVVMGVGTVYSRNNSPEKMLKRGLLLFLLAYVLNIFRGGLPVLTGMISGTTFTRHGTDEMTLLDAIFNTDIMTLAGVSYMCMALFKKMKIEPVAQFLIGLVAAGIGYLLVGIGTGNQAIDLFLGIFWATNNYSVFTLLTWLVFPTFGVWFGTILMHCTDKDRLYRILFPASLVGVIISLYLKHFTPDYYTYGYYFMDIKNVVYALFYPIVLFAICNKLAKFKLWKESKLITYCAKETNSIYCVSWVVIVWADYLIFDVFKLDLSDGVIFAMVPVLFLVVYGIVRFKTGVIKRSRGYFD